MINDIRDNLIITLEKFVQVRSNGQPSFAVSRSIPGVSKLIRAVGLRHFENNPVEKRVSDAILSVTDDNFEDQVLKAERPVLVDYWAEWCGPCKRIAPILDEIADEYQGKITFAKLNIDESPKTPQRYGVRGIPTLMLFKNGEVEATKVGMVSKTKLAEFLDSNT